MVISKDNQELIRGHQEQANHEVENVSGFESVIAPFDLENIPTEKKHG